MPVLSTEIEMERLKRRLNDYRRNILDLQSHYIRNPVYSGWTRFGYELDSQTIVGRLFSPYNLHKLMSSDDHGEMCIAHYTKEPTDYGELERQIRELETIIDPMDSMVDSLPSKLTDRLKLPKRSRFSRCSMWWVRLHHLAWYFPIGDALSGKRKLLQEHEHSKSRTGNKITVIRDEKIAQLFGHGIDIYPGLVFSELKSNAYVASVEAIDLLLQLMEKSNPDHDEIPGHVQSYVALKNEFSSVSRDIEKDSQPRSIFKLIKCSDCSKTPPACKWAGYSEGGAPTRHITLSELNEEWEFCFLRGMDIDWFCQLAGKAGALLPSTVVDEPIMFVRSTRQNGTIRIQQSAFPVMNRSDEARWIGFVFATLLKSNPELVEVYWCSKIEDEHQYGFATLTVNPFEASAQAIELAGLTLKKPSVKKNGKSTRPQLDKKIEARDKWIYQQCIKGTDYENIKINLERKCTTKKWEPIDSIQGIRQAAIRYAKRQGLPEPAKRK